MLLRYLETDGEGMSIRPWVWISLLFLLPMADSVVVGSYFWRTTRILVRTEGIITQFVFEHALRIRVKDDTPSTTEDGATPKAGSNLIGRINNLASSDLGSITDGMPQRSKSCLYSFRLTSTFS